MAKSIIGAALAGHSNWNPRPVTRPPAPPRPGGVGTAGAALLGHPGGAPGVGSAGSGILGAAGALTGAPAPRPPAAPAAPVTHPVTSTVTPPPPDLSGNRWLGYLSADQLNGLNQAGYQFTQSGGNAQAQIDNANTDYNTSLASSQYQHDVQQQQAVEEMAARGLSVSGIRDTDLTDINRSLAERQALANQTLTTLVGEATRAITALNSSWGSTQMLYQSYAASNAANSPEAQPYQVTQQVAGPAPIQASTANGGNVNAQQQADAAAAARQQAQNSDRQLQHRLGGGAPSVGNAGTGIRGARRLSAPRR